GVVSASIAQYSPVSGSSSSSNFSMPGLVPQPNKELDVYHVEVGPRFFETLGTPIMLGRSIGPGDTAASPVVTVVNQIFVREYLEGQNPIGRHFMLGS